MKFRYLAKDKISKLPKTPGIYAFKKAGQFLYIGKAVNLSNRVSQHKNMLGRAERIAYIGTKSNINALLLEAKLIKKYQPKYNIQWRDDKNYFYIGMTKEAFPRIFITHQPKLKINYVGPFTNGRELKDKLKELRKIYPYRTCKTLPKKPCLWYHLKQCPAPCLFRGQRIEAYDVANIQGRQAAGSMVTFINRKPNKNFYRKFKIKTINKPNDLAMLKEVLTRRLNHPEWGLPDLILIDGGRAQLNAAIAAISQKTHIAVAAIAKKKNELYMENLKKPVLLKNLSRETFNLVLHLRDEAHRFAQAYHHKLRDKSLFY